MKADNATCTTAAKTANFSIDDLNKVMEELKDNKVYLVPLKFVKDLQVRFPFKDIRVNHITKDVIIIEKPNEDLFLSPIEINWSLQDQPEKDNKK